MRASLLLLGVVVLFSFANSAFARKPLPEKKDLFAAIEARDVDVVLIPKDATRLTLKIENRTDKPLLLKIPESFVGVPVLAQQLGFGQGNFGQGNFGQGNGFGQQGNFGNGNGFGNNQQGGGNQSVGGNRNGGQGNIGGGNRGGGNGFFRVEPRRILKLKFPCACLDFGKADPRPRIPYRLVRLEDFRSDAKLAGVMKEWSLSTTPQRIAQLAIWHATNDVSWKELGSLEYKHAFGGASPQYSASEILQARAFYDRAMRRRQATPTASRPTARR